MDGKTILKRRMEDKINNNKIFCFDLIVINRCRRRKLKWNVCHFVESDKKLINYALPFQSMLIAAQNPCSEANIVVSVRRTLSWQGNV